MLGLILQMEDETFGLVIFIPINGSGSQDALIPSQIGMQLNQITVTTNMDLSVPIPNGMIILLKEL